MTDSRQPGDEAGSAPSGAVLMWEAKAAPGAGDALVAWVWKQVWKAWKQARQRPPSPDGDGDHEAAVEVFRSGDRVVVILPLGPATAAAGELPEPPSGLVARPPHRWRFDRLSHPTTGDAG